MLPKNKDISFNQSWIISHEIHFDTVLFLYLYIFWRWNQQDFLPIKAVYK